MAKMITPELKAEVLHNLAQVGKVLANKANGNYWSCEQRHIAEGYKPAVVAMRICYRTVLDTDSIGTMVHSMEKAKLAIQTGIEYNFLCRTIDLLK